MDRNNRVMKRLWCSGDFWLCEYVFLGWSWGFIAVLAIFDCDGEWAEFAWLTLKLPITKIVVCFIIFVIFANSMDPDQNAPLGAVWSGSTLFVCMQK